MKTRVLKQRLVVFKKQLIRRILLLFHKRHKLRKQRKKFLNSIVGSISMPKISTRSLNDNPKKQKLMSKWLSKMLNVKPNKWLKNWLIRCLRALFRNKCKTLEKWCKRILIKKFNSNFNKRECKRHKLQLKWSNMLLLHPKRSPQPQYLRKRLQLLRLHRQRRPQLQHQRKKIHLPHQQSRLQLQHHRRKQQLQRQRRRHQLLHQRRRSKRRKLLIQKKLKVIRKTKLKIKNLTKIKKRLK